MDVDLFGSVFFPDRPHALVEQNQRTLMSYVAPATVYTCRVAFTASNTIYTYIYIFNCSRNPQCRNRPRYMLRRTFVMLLRGQSV